MPEDRVAVMVLVTEEPLLTETFPLESEKSNVDATLTSTLQMVVVPPPVMLDKLDRLATVVCELRKA